MTHEPAPRILDTPGPWRTPGTRLVWWSLSQWLAGAYELHGRRKASAGLYRQQTVHLSALAAQPRVILKANIEALRALVRHLNQPGVKPVQGRRAGTAWERVLVCGNNAIANHIHTETLERAVLEEERQLMEGEDLNG